MALSDELPEAWTVWDRVVDDRLILAFRPDVFDGQTHPPVCLPTIYVREGRRSGRQPGPEPEPGSEGSWTVSLILEPEVRELVDECDSFEAAEAAAVDLAAEFVAGEIDLEGMYQLPREDYLAALEGLVGR